jgi:hypothetical protein
MWLLTRNLTPGEVRTCKLSGKMIVYGDYYYQDSDDASIYIKATEYHKYEKDQKAQTFDYSELEKAQSELEYSAMMKRAQKEYLAATILKDKIFKNGTIQESAINGLPVDEE